MATKMPGGVCPYCFDTEFTGMTPAHPDYEGRKCVSCSDMYVVKRGTSYPLENPSDIDSGPHV